MNSKIIAFIHGDPLLRHRSLLLLWGAFLFAVASKAAHRNDSIEKGEKVGDRGWFIDRKLPAKGRNLCDSLAVS